MVDAGVFPYWPPTGEFTQLVFSVDAPEGNDSILAVGAINPIGVSIWDASNKGGLRPLYQDHNKFVYQVHAGRTNGRDYAFAADFGGSEDMGDRCGK